MRDCSVDFWRQAFREIIGHDCAPRQKTLVTGLSLASHCLRGSSSQDWRSQNDSAFPGRSLGTNS